MSIARLTIRIGLALTAALVLTNSPPAHAQQPDSVVLSVGEAVLEVRLRDGSTLFARVVEIDGDRVVLRTDAGTRIEVERAQIRSASPVRGTIRDGEVWVEDPNRTRLLFGPTGRSLRAGEGYIGAFELIFPFAAFGLTDRITLAGGTPVLPFMMGDIVYLAPKVQLVSTERAQLSSGVLAFFNLTSDRDDTETVGVAYGAGTWGSADDAVTAGAGWGFAGSDIQNHPVFLLGGETRLSRRLKLVTENYLISYENRVYQSPTMRPGDPYQEPTFETEVERLGLLGLGLRFFGERLAGDLGLGMGVGGEDGTFCCVPIANFVYNFGGSR